jgi:hypothetical protein
VVHMLMVLWSWGSGYYEGYYGELAMDTYVGVVLATRY